MSVAEGMGTVLLSAVCEEEEYERGTARHTGSLNSRRRAARNWLLARRRRSRSFTGRFRHWGSTAHRRTGGWDRDGDTGRGTNALKRSDSLCLIGLATCLLDAGSDRRGQDIGFSA